MNIKNREILYMAIAALTLALYGCNGGGSSTSTSSVTVSGTAATGAPIANSQITITGAKGSTVTVTTGADGSYSADVSKLTAPYLEKVVTPSNATLYSVGTGAGTVNIHPLTDLIVHTWYEAQGTTADAAFADPTANPPPTAKEVDVITTVVEKVVDKWLVANGIDPTQFNLISTPFKANSSGFDAVLDTLTVDTSNPAAPSISVNAGTNGLQTTDMTVASGGNISADTSITVGSVTSTSFTSAVVPTSTAAQTALTGVLTTLSNLASTINTKGTTLAGTDILPFVDSGYLGGGRNASQFAANMASDMAGLTLDSFTVNHIISFDATNNIIAIDGQLTMTLGNNQIVRDVNGNDDDGLFFKLESDGSWKFYGDQRKGKINLTTETSQRMLGTTSGCQTGCDGVYYDLQAQLNVPTGSVTSASVTGNFGGTQQTINMTKASGTVTDGSGLVTDQWDALGGVGQTFYGLTGPSQFPVAGSSYTFKVTFSNNSTATYTRILGASTSEAMTLQSGVEATVGHSISASLGQPITLSWNLPVSFPIASVEMYAHESDTSGNGCDISGPQLAANATTGTMTLPSTCNNLSVAGSPNNPSISIVVTGTSGESTNIWYAFQ